MKVASRGIRTLYSIAFAAAAFQFLERTAQADIGIPMLAVVWPASWLAFLPIVAIEALVAHRLLRVRLGMAFKISAWANVVSTVVGIPVTWAALLLLELLVGAALPGTLSRSPTVRVVLSPLFQAWLGPVRHTWKVYFAGAILCVPLFFSSVAVEAWTVTNWVSKGDARRWAWRANAITYGLAVLIFATMTVISYRSGAPL